MAVGSHLKIAGIYMELSINGGIPWYTSITGCFHGKSQTKVGSFGGTLWSRKPPYTINSIDYYCIVTINCWLFKETMNYQLANINNWLFILIILSDFRAIIWFSTILWTINYGCCFMDFFMDIHPPFPHSLARPPPLFTMVKSLGAPVEWDDVMFNDLQQVRIWKLDYSLH